MNSLKKIKLLLCLAFSFILFFSNVFSVHAESIQAQQSLKQCIDQKEYHDEIAECEIYYGVTNTNNVSNGKIIWTVG